MYKIIKQCAVALVVMLGATLSSVGQDSLPTWCTPGTACASNYAGSAPGVFPGGPLKIPSNATSISVTVVSDWVTSSYTASLQTAPIISGGGSGAFTQCATATISTTPGVTTLTCSASTSTPWSYAQLVMSGASAAGGFHGAFYAVLPSSFARGSGFPITLGSTLIAANSQTSNVAGLNTTGNAATATATQALGVTFTPDATYAALNTPFTTTSTSYVQAASLEIPAGTLGANSVIDLTARGGACSGSGTPFSVCTASGGQCTFQFYVATSSTGQTSLIGAQASGGAGGPITGRISMTMLGSQSAEAIDMDGYANGAYGAIGQQQAINSATSNIFFNVFVKQATSGGCFLDQAYLVIHTPVNP